MRCCLGQKWLGFRSRERTWWLHRIMRCKREENIPPNLSEANNKMLRSLWTRIFITKNNLNILHKSIKRRKFGKNYLFTTKFKGNSLIFIRFSVGVPLLDMTGKPVRSNSGTPTEKGSECLNHHLKKGHTKRMALYSVFKRFKKHILGTQKFFWWRRRGVLWAWKPTSVLWKKRWGNNSNGGIIENSRAYAKNCCVFELGEKRKQQISGTVIEMKFSSPWNCIFMNNLETKLLEVQRLQLMVPIHCWYVFYLDLWWRESLSR